MYGKTLSVYKIWSIRPPVRWNYVVSVCKKKGSTPLWTASYLKYGEIAQLVEQVKMKICFCEFSSERTAIVKDTSKFHEKDRVVSSNLTLPAKCPAGGMEDTHG